MNNQVLYKYSKMDLEQFALFEENVSPIIKEVQFQTEVQFSYDKNSRILCSKIVATMILKEKPLLKADFRSYFEIAPESIEDLRQERNIIFPPPSASAICITVLWFFARRYPCEDTRNCA